MFTYILQIVQMNPIFRKVNKAYSCNDLAINENNGSKYNFLCMKVTCVLYFL